MQSSASETEKLKSRTEKLKKKLEESEAENAKLKEFMAQQDNELLHVGK